MEGFLVRGCELILPGWRWLYESQVAVFTPFGAVLTRGTAVFVTGRGNFAVGGPGKIVT